MTTLHQLTQQATSANATDLMYLDRAPYDTSSDYKIEAQDFANTAIFNAASIQGFGVLSTPPTINQVLVYNGAKYAPTTLTLPISPYVTIGIGGDYPDYSTAFTALISANQVYTFKQISNVTESASYTFSTACTVMILVDDGLTYNANGYSAFNFGTNSVNLYMSAPSNFTYQYLATSNQYQIDATGSTNSQIQIINASVFDLTTAAVNSNFLYCDQSTTFVTVINSNINIANSANSGIVCFNIAVNDLSITGTGASSSYGLNVSVMFGTNVTIYGTIDTTNPIIESAGASQIYNIVNYSGYSAITVFGGIVSIDGQIANLTISTLTNTIAYLTAALEVSLIIGDNTFMTVSNSLIVGVDESAVTTKDYISFNGSNLSFASIGNSAVNTACTISNSICQAALTCNGQVTASNFNVTQGLIVAANNCQFTNLTIGTSGSGYTMAINSGVQGTQTALLRVDGGAAGYVDSSGNDTNTISQISQFY